ncbi:hypothetical protein ACFW9L_32450 [Streptomyces sp. NPDC059517]|uniref:hypothetical protein n=1 Tax=Streptomyces sp. NPDC059517 TaxID=3346855 RepID=UPI0036D1E97A
MSDLIDVAVRVLPPPDGDEEELRTLTVRLRRELLRTDVVGAQPVRDEEAPEGAKGLAAVAGLLAVQVRTFHALRQLVESVRSWAGRSGRTVKVCLDGDCLEVTGATPQVQEQLVGAWLARHAPTDS